MIQEKHKYQLVEMMADGEWQEEQQKQDKFKVGDIKLQCRGKNKAVEICVREECDCGNRLFCQTSKCKKCKKDDDDNIQCRRQPIAFINKLLNNRAREQKRFDQSIVQVENKAIMRLTKSQTEMLHRYHLGDLEKDYLETAEKLYSGPSNLEGAQLKSLLLRLENPTKQNIQLGDRLIKRFSKAVEELIDQIIALKEQIYHCFVSNKETKIDKSILIDQLDTERKDLLMKTLKEPKQLKLLYRASEHAFSVSAFHSKCDNIENTLTVLKTEFGKTIAGFTKYPWTQRGTFVSDAGRHCWLLSLDLKQKMVPQKDKDLIYCKSDYGPTFGGGHDLYLGDRCHKTSNCYANFPATYNFEGEPKYVQNQEACRAFSGATNSSNFRVEQYQVFEVIWN